MTFIYRFLPLAYKGKIASESRKLLAVKLFREKLYFAAALSV